MTDKQQQKLKETHEALYWAEVLANDIHNELGRNYPQIKTIRGLVKQLQHMIKAVARDIKSISNKRP